MKNISFIACLLALAAVGLTGLAQAEEKLDYKAMIEDVGGFLNDALLLYKNGRVQEAKQKAQAAYFEVYENLEGPIRINISAQKNTELEEEFIAIRKMIVAKEPVAAIEKRIREFMTDLKALIPELEDGVELVAEAAESAQPLSGIEPAWLQACDNIQARLGRALDVYTRGDPKAAADLVIQTQFDEYKNSLLETAVKRHVSSAKDFENNSGFSEIAEMIRSRKSPTAVDAQIAGLIKGLREDLPGLPLIDGAVSKKDAAQAAATAIPERDWSAVTADLFREIDVALALYENGDMKNAISRLQDAYFDVFEASGMEGKIGARDANFKSELEGHFNMIVGRMKNGAPAEEMTGALSAMKADFARAVAVLDNGSDSPAALFFYSLMIILREGIEAILIITAIIAYLVRSGNADKLRVIYRGVWSALALSVVTAVLVKWVFKTSAASQEILEGATMLLAAAVLFSVSYWLISKAEAQKWMSYIKEKLAGSVSSNSLRALWFTAFLAVYREGAETVLFYQALASDVTVSGLTAVAGGFVVGGILLIGIYLGMRYGALKLPLRPFFLFTGALLYYMAFVFAGKGMMELVEGKLFEPSLLSWMPRVPFLGLYPYVQTLIPQALILLAAAAALVYLANHRSVTAKEVATDDRN